MRKLLVSAAIAIVAAGYGVTSAAAPGSDPVVGTWQLNVSKSTFAAGPAAKSQIRMYSQSGQSITLVMKTTGADGKAATTRTTYQLNGKDFAVAGNPDYDSLSGKQIDSNTANFTLKKGGTMVGATTRTVSNDGKTLTSELKMSTANGGKVESVMVFDKQ
jgi:hypothetical protein